MKTRDGTEEEEEKKREYAELTSEKQDMDETWRTMFRHSWERVDAGWMRWSASERDNSKNWISSDGDIWCDIIDEKEEVMRSRGPAALV